MRLRSEPIVPTQALHRVADMLVRIGPRPIMLARYLAHRLRSGAARRTLRITYRRRVARPAVAHALSPWPFRLPHIHNLPEQLAAAAAAVRSEADDACSHRFDLLGSGPVDLGESIDWHRDFKSGFAWKRDFYQDLRVTRLDDDSDAKVPWELSRGHQLLALARAACVFEEPSYADALEGQLNDWIDANPPGIGINWANTMEVGIRATNWVWALGTIEGWRPVEASTRARVIASLEVHGRHIASNLEGSPYMRSNHYLGDLLGMLAIGWALRENRRAWRWFTWARRAFEREIHLQVLEDGVDFEASTAYHGLVMEMFLIARWLCATAGTPPSTKFDDRLARMLAFSCAIRDRSGYIPLFGDNDSGRVLPADASREPTHDNLLWMGAAILGEDRPLPGTPHPEVAWTFGVDAWTRIAASAREPTPRRTAFPQGGYYVLADERLHVVVRCGDVGQNGNGGHAHNDPLSFTLSLNEPLIVDPGTAHYTADPDARNQARATAAHNTVMVAGEEINPLAPRELFRLKQIARPTVELWSTSGSAIALQASHDGYERLPQRVIHRRRWELPPGGPFLRVRDELLGHGDCQAETFLHLAAPTVATLGADGGVVVTTREGERLHIACDGPVGAVEIRDGWVSTSFGASAKAPVIVATVSGALPLRFGWTLALVPPPVNPSPAP
jgi:uncharacterized heparinase superfamily protein